MNSKMKKVKLLCFVVAILLYTMTVQSVMANEISTSENKKDIWRPQNFTIEAELEGKGAFWYSSKYDGYTQQLQPILYEFEDYICVEDFFLGKPVKAISYGDRLDSNGRYLSPRKGIYISDNVVHMEANMFQRNNFYYIHFSENQNEIPEYICAEDKNLKRVYIPASVKTIGRYAFRECNSLDNVEIASGVKVIEKGAFASCKKLKKLHIPDSVTEIAKDAFAGSKNLVLYCTRNSYAYRYAKKNKIPVSLLSSHTTYQTKSLSVDETSIEVGTNEIYLLFPMLEPFYTSNRVLSFASSNPLVATVSQSGKITGVKEGKAVITIQTTDGSNKLIQIPVSVKQGKSRLNPCASTFQYQRGRSIGNLDTYLINRNPKAEYTFKAYSGGFPMDFIVEGNTVKVKAYYAGEIEIFVRETYKGVERYLGNFTARIMPTMIYRDSVALPLGTTVMDPYNLLWIKDGYGLTYQFISEDTNMLTIQDNGGDTVTFTGRKAGTVKVRIIETYAGISMGIGEQTIKIK